MNHEKALSTAVGSKAAAAKTPINVAGKWVNQYGSSAELVIKGTALSGRYKSKVGSKDSEVEGTIAGFITEDVLAFSVLWPAEYGSVTSWVGQIVDDNGTETLKTLWHLAMNVAEKDEPKKFWTSIFAGADNFTRVV